MIASARLMLSKFIFKNLIDQIKHIFSEKKMQLLLALCARTVLNEMMMGRIPLAQVPPIYRFQHLKEQHIDEYHQISFVKSSHP